MCEFEGFVLVDAVFGDEAGKEDGVDAAGYIVAGGNGEEGAGVVVEANGVVEAGGLGGLLAEAHHSLRRIMEPPGWAELERGIVAGEWSEFSAVGGLVEGEEDEGQAGVVAVLREQRAKAADVVGGRRNVGTLVATEAFVNGEVVVADGAGMDLHGEAVFDTHAGHLGEHLGLEELGIAGVGFASEDPGIEAAGFIHGEVGGEGGEMAVVGGGCAVGLEEEATGAKGVEIATPGCNVFVGDFAELVQVFLEAGELGVNDGVRAEGGKDSSLSSLML